MLKYGNQCIDEQANHRCLEIQVISGVGSSSPFSNSEFLVLRFLNLLKYGNQCIDKQANHRYLSISGMSSVGSSSQFEISKTRISELQTY
jgi:hypothetical protein